MPNPLSGLRVRRSHPYYRKSWRWWVAQQPAWKLVVWGVSLLGLTSILLAALQVLSTVSRTPTAMRFWPGTFVVRVLAMFRTLVGANQYPAVPGNHADAALATIASIITLFLPALIIAVVLVRIWSVNAFVWRREASVCLPWEVDEAAYRREKAGTEDATIAIRFYKRLRGLRISDLRCEAYLRFLEISPVDGTSIIRTMPLQVLGPSGSGPGPGRGRSLARARLSPSGSPWMLHWTGELSG